MTFNVHNFQHQSHISEKSTFQFYFRIIFLHIYYDVENIFVERCRKNIFYLCKFALKNVTSLLTCFRDSQLYFSQNCIDIRLGISLSRRFFLLSPPLVSYTENCKCTWIIGAHLFEKNKILHLSLDPYTKFGKIEIGTHVTYYNSCYMQFL